MKKSLLLSLITLTLVITLASCPDPNGGGDTGPTAGDQKTVSVASIPSFNLRYVPAATGGFQRDSTSTNITKINQGYWMAETEVTQELFQAVMGTNPSNFTSGAAAGETQAKRPVELVSWYDAIAFCNKLSLLDGKTLVYSVQVSSSEVDWAGLTYDDIPSIADPDWNGATINAGASGYRLPTEMQWMWAAMGAAATGYNKAFAGSTGSNNVNNFAWYGNNGAGTTAGGKTHEVGKKTANELGLYDMSGNVRELCWDWLGSYPTGEKIDYTGAASGSDRVFRGGGWYNPAGDCAVAIRYGIAPNVRSWIIGFRVVRH